jgi:RNA polymerase sigma-70 factor (ECF subfamily)
MNTIDLDPPAKMTPARQGNRWRTRRTPCSLAPESVEETAAREHPMKACDLPEPEQNGAGTAIEDAELMRAIADRDPEALAALYDRYSGILKALVIRVIHDEAEADDLLQEIFMQIWRQAKNYSQKKGQALGWIVTLTRRRAIDRLRKRQAYHRVTERLELETEHQPDAWIHNRIDDDILQDDLRQFLRRRIEALPALQRQAIDLAFFKGMSQREIAIFTDTPLGTIKTRLELGLRKLYDSVRGLRDKI